MILITGATGTIGRELVRVLAANGHRVRAMTRRPADATPPPGVEVVRADFTDAGSLKLVAEGVDAVFMLSPPGRWVAQHDEAMITAVPAAGVPRAVKLSTISASENSADSHFPGEQAVRSSGLAWTVLRPSSFASNTLRWAGAIRAGTPIPNPMGTGTQGVIDPRDVAEVAALALTSPDHHGRIHTLTGPDLLSVPDMARELGDALGRTVGTVEVRPEDYGNQLRAAGLDPALVDIAVDGARTIAEGRNAVLTSDVDELLGRPARSFATWVRDHRGVFTD